MRHVCSAFGLIILLLTPAYSFSAQKITQASHVTFTAHDLLAVAIEELGRSPVLALFDITQEVYRVTFSDSFKANDKFTYTGSLLRFGTFVIPGIDLPLLIGVAMQPGGSDNLFEVRIISKEIGGKIHELQPSAIQLSNQGGIHIGSLGKGKVGMVIWEFQWSEEAHYEPHAYKIKMYDWDANGKNFVFKREFLTGQKFVDGCEALKHYEIPCRDIRDEIIPLEKEEITTLGLENLLLNHP